jgi:hypothetical protein
MRRDDELQGLHVRELQCGRQDDMLPEDRNWNKEVLSWCSLGFGCGYNPDADSFPDSFPDSLADSFPDSFPNAIADTITDTIANAITDAIADSLTYSDTLSDTDADTDLYDFVDPNRPFNCCVINKWIADSLCSASDRLFPRWITSNSDQQVVGESHRL